MTIPANSPTTIYQLIEESTERCGESPALTFVKTISPEMTDESTSYEELLANINRAVRFFYDHFDQQGKERPVISFLLPNIPQTHYILWAAETAGIANPLNPLLSVDALTGLLTTAKTDILIALGPNPFIDVWEKACEVVKQLEKKPKLVSVAFPNQSGNAFFDALLPEYSGSSLPDKWLPDLDDTAAYFHTGGTTSIPKLAIHTHRNQWYSAKAYRDAMQANKGDTSINGLPMFHVAGATVMSLGSLATGGHCILPTMGGFRDPNVIAAHWKLVERYQVKIAGGIPTSVAAMSEIPLGSSDISSLRFLVAGGAPVPQSTVKAIKQLTDLDVYQIYGMTEVAGVVTMPNLDYPPPVGSVGYIREDIEIKIDTSSHASGDIGEICIKGPMVIPGYLGVNEAFLQEGWLHTGDLGYIDKDNNLYLTGRSKDLIIRSGHNIDPVVIESCLESHPAVSLAAAIGMPDSYAGELPVVFVQLQPNQKITPEELHDYAFKHIDERPACPKFVYILDALPVTAVGKIHKVSLRAEVAKMMIESALNHFPVTVTAHVLSCGGIEVQILADTDDSTLASTCIDLQSQLNLSIKVLQQEVI